MRQRPLLARIVSVVWPLIASDLALLAYATIGSTFLNGYWLDLGAFGLPMPQHTYYLFFWTLFGSIASVFLLVGVTRALLLFPDRIRTLTAPSPGDRWWVIGGMLAAIIVPWSIRAFVLRGAPLTDDEGTYRFIAQLLAQGRLWIPSYPHREFYDRIFMINDGRLIKERCHKKSRISFVAERNNRDFIYLC